MAKQVVMYDFEGKEIKLGARVFFSFGGNKHVLGKVSGFKGKGTLILLRQDIELNTHSDSKTYHSYEPFAKNVVVL